MAGYPWISGQVLTAADLDAAFTNLPTVSSVTATGSTTARTLADRFGDVANVLDWGVVHDPSGIHVTANTAAYQAALNGGAQRIVHPRGLTVVHTGLSITRPLELEINGTLLSAPTTLGQTYYSSISIASSNVTVRLGVTGVIDGNLANQHGVTDPIDGVGGIVTAQNLAIAPAIPWTDVYVYGPGTIQNIANWPVSIYGTNRTKVCGVRMLDSGNAPQFAQGCVNFEFAHNYVENNPDYGWAAYQGCTYGSCHHNVFKNTATVGVLNDGGSTTGYNMLPCHNIYIHHNLIEGATVWGLSVHNSSYAGSVANAYDIEFTDNQVVNGANANAVNPACFYADNCRNISFKRNLISGGGTTAQNNFAIQASISTALGLVIEDNIIENLGVTGTGFGVLVGAPGLVVRNNIIRDTQTVHTMHYGTFGTCGSGTVLTGNIVLNMIAANNGATAIADTIFLDPLSKAGTFTTLSATTSATFLTSTVQGAASANAIANVTANATNGSSAFLIMTPRAGSGGVGGIYTGNASSLVLGYNSTNVITIDASGMNGPLGVSSPAAATVSQLNVTTLVGPNIRAGTGAASGTQPKGSLWMRTDGGVGTTMYVSQGGGTWNPVAGV